MRKLFLLAIAVLLFAAMPVNAESLQAAEREQVDEYLYKGNVCSIQKDFAKAIEYYCKAIAIKEKDAKIYLTRGKAYLIEKQYDLAMADFQKVTELGTIYDQSYIRVSNYLALIPYSKEISLDDKNIDAYQKRAKIYRGIKQYDLALEDYNKIIELQPANRNAYLERGIIYQYDLNIYDAALDDYKKAIVIDPANADSYYLRGELYLHLQKLDLSIANYTKAIELNSQNNRYYYYRRAIAYGNKKRYDLAVKDYTAAIKLGNQDFNEIVYRHRGKAYLELKEYDFYRYMDEKETQSEIDERIKYAKERLKALSGYKM